MFVQMISYFVTRFGKVSFIKIIMYIILYWDGYSPVVTTHVILIQLLITSRFLNSLTHNLCHFFIFNFLLEFNIFGQHLYSVPVLG